MRATFTILSMIVLVGAVVGCQPAGKQTADKDGKQDEKPVHKHEGDDTLFWQREGLEEGDFKIKLGHHGTKVRENHELEPAVSITLDGKAVADAKVFNSLLDADDKKVLAEEVATIYEPETSDEPAHYAQGGLQVPKDLKKVIIRFRIELPDGNEFKQDVPVLVEKDDHDH